jgi:uroporphyrinogen-III synthase
MTLVMLPLGGRRIALLESRARDEIAMLVHRLGGVPVQAPAVGEVPCHDDFGRFADGLTGRRFSLAIFLSGSGATTLLEEARFRGRLHEVTAVLKQVTIACRGAKTLAALGRFGLRPRITTARPHTTRVLMSALSRVDLRDRGVVLVHYGERNDEIAGDLRARGARLDEVQPYGWALPDDIAPVAAVVRDAIAHRLDAVLFTNEIQCRHLFEVAAEMSRVEGLTRSLNRDVVVGAVGPVCAGALCRAGITPDVIPAMPDMPSLIQAVAQYFDSLDRRTGGRS